MCRKNPEKKYNTVTLCGDPWMVGQQWLIFYPCACACVCVYKTAAN